MTILIYFISFITVILIDTGLKENKTTEQNKKNSLNGIWEFYNN